MLTVEDLSPGAPLPAPIRINVSSVDWTAPGRRAVIDATDMKGNPIRLIDFEGAEITQEWKEGYSYRVSHSSVKRGSGDFQLQLESTSSTIIEPLGLSGATRVFVFGDTHVGYRHRSRSGKNKWSTDVNCRTVFVNCLERA